jgi:hypothetical protein
MTVIKITERFPDYKKIKQSAERILSLAKKSDLTEILIIGTDKEGKLFLAGFPPDPGNALWLMEVAKKKLLSGDPQ